MLKQQALESLVVKLDRYVNVRKALIEISMPKEMGSVMNVALVRTETIIHQVADSIANIDGAPDRVLQLYKQEEINTSFIRKS